ncbi:unnamed protein product [Symbiodinium natans]|uniref:Uncharacterized protein n=1 Tax=Symbiodinium natans TaxID=878477 RepID=A0A812HZV8_9DINO|nr:unnamed protein product [Symbiodinium natans]
MDSSKNSSSADVVGQLEREGVGSCIILESKDSSSTDVVGQLEREGVESIGVATHHALMCPQHAMAFSQRSTDDGLFFLVDSGASVHLLAESLVRDGHVQVVEELSAEGPHCVTATGALIEVRRKVNRVRAMFFLEPSKATREEVACVEFVALLAPVQFSLLSLGLLSQKGWNVNFKPGEAKVRNGRFQFRTHWQQYRGGASAASASSGPKTKAMPKKKTVIRTKAMPKKKTVIRTKAMPKPHTQTVQREIPLSRKEVRSLPILTLRDHLDHHHYAVMEANCVANLMKPMAVDQKEFQIENSAVMVTKDRVTVTSTSRPPPTPPKVPPPVGGGHGLPYPGRSTAGKSITFTSTASTSNTSPGKQRRDDSSDASSGAGDTTFFCVFLERGNEQVTEPQRSKQKHVCAEPGLAGVERELVVGVEGEGERVERGSLGEVEREALGH